MNKKKFIYTLFAILFAIELCAQSPPHINYQAILRNTQTGTELSDQEVFIIAKFIEGGPEGEIVYQEEHPQVTTSRLGLINLQLGDGYAIEGSFNAIPWAGGNIWLTIEMDAGEGLKPLGTTKFSSVPYALYASGGPEPEPNLDNDPTNEIQDLNLSENILTISDNPNATPIYLGIYENILNLDNDPTNEIQDLTLSGNTLKISGNDSATDIDLGSYKQDLTLTGYILKITDNPDATPIDLSPYLDPAGGVQDLSISDNLLTITGNPNATPIDLYMYENIPNLDNDPTNEIQELILSGNSLTISDNPSATPIDLSPYVNVPSLDDDPTNEIQDLILSEHSLTISDNPSATPIDLNPYVNVPSLDDDPTNEIQDLILSEHSLTISDNPTATPIDLSGYVNAHNLDNDPTNEIQDLILSGHSLTISDNPSATPIDLNPYVNVPSLDDDPTNEIQDLNLSDHTLTISDNPNATPIDLSEYENQSLLKNQIFVGNETGVATATPLIGDVVLTDGGTTYVNALRNIPISTTAPLDGQKLSYNAGTNVWEPVDDLNSSPITKYYSVDPMDFVELTDPDNDIELKEHNGLKFFNGSAPFAMIRKTDIRGIGAPVHLPHGATITEIKFYIKDSGSQNMQFSLQRKRLTNYDVGNSTLASTTSSGISGKGTITYPVTSNNLVNNQLYTYRMFVRFHNYESDDDEDDPQDIKQVVYGAVITYIE